MKIGMSIAHNTKSPGACHQGFCEHEESEIWTNLLIEELHSLKIETFLSSAAHLSLKKAGDPGGSKVAELNKEHCNMVLEIHFNAGGNLSTQGCEVLYYPGSMDGELIAVAVQDKLCMALGNNYRGAKEGWYQMDRPGIVDFYGDEDGDEKPDYFLKYTNCPAIIIEPEFIQQSSFIMDNRLNGVKSIAEAIQSLGIDYE